MNKENIYDAMGNIDGEYIEAAAETGAKKKKSRRFPWAAIAAAALVTVMTVGAAAAAGGRFTDIKNIFGTVTGTKFEDATDDLKLEIIGFKNGSPEIIAERTDPEKLPFSLPGNTLKLGEYQLTDSSGNVIAERKYNSDDAPEIRYNDDANGEFGDEAAEEYIGISGIDPDKLTKTGRKVIYLTAERNADGTYSGGAVEEREIYASADGKEYLFIENSSPLAPGEYEISVKSVIMLSKGDQDMEITGEWRLVFEIAG